MASSKHAFRVLLQRSVPSAPRLGVRRFATSPARPVYSNSPSSRTGSAAAAPSEDKNPYASSQVSPPVSHIPASSSLSSPSSPSSSSAAKQSSSSPPQPPVPNPGQTIHNIPANELPPYKYPSQDPTPLPQVQSSFDPALTQSALASALGQHSREQAIDWASSYHGLSTEPFSTEAQAILQAPISDNDVEVKPDGIIYLPEIKYRRILNAAFGPGGWGLAPRGELHVGDKVVTREFALVVGGRFAAQARGECGYYGDDNIPNAVEGCKSNALMRCCKDLGIASELWDPRFIRKWKKQYCREVEVYSGTGVRAMKKKISMRKDDEIVAPFRPIEPARASPSSSSSSPSSYKPSGGSSYGSSSGGSYGSSSGGSYGSSSGGSYGSSSAARTTTGTAARSTTTTSAARPAVAARTATTAAKTTTTKA